MSGPQGPEPTATRPDAGLVFRAEMWLTHFLLGSWPYILGVTVAVLVAVLVYGQYTSWVQREQRAASEQIAEIESGLYKDLLEAMEPAARERARARTPDLVSLLVNGGVDEASRPALVAGADELTALSAEISGTSRVEALLKAAELYRLGSDDAKRATALAAAAEDAEGPLLFAAVGGLANLDLEADRGDEAVARLRSLTVELDGYLAEQAMLDLGLTLEHLGRRDEAIAAYDEFATRFSASPRAAEAAERRAALGAAAPAPAPEVAP